MGTAHRRVSRLSHEGWDESWGVRLRSDGGPCTCSRASVQEDLVDFEARPLRLLEERGHMSAVRLQPAASDRHGALCSGSPGAANDFSKRLCKHLHGHAGCRFQEVLAHTEGHTLARFQAREELPACHDAGRLQGRRHCGQVLQELHSRRWLFVHRQDSVASVCCSWALRRELRHACGIGRLQARHSQEALLREVPQGLGDPSGVQGCFREAAEENGRRQRG